MSLVVYTHSIFNEITKLEDIKVPNEVIINEKIDKLIKEFEILKIPSEKKQLISEKLSEKRKLEGILKEENINFPYNQEIINEISNFNSTQQNTIDFVALRVLYMVIPWITMITEETEEDFIYPMLSAFITVMKSSYFSTGKKCYKRIFEAIFTIPHFYKFNLVVRELHKYLQIDPSIDLMCYTLGRTINSDATPTDPFFAQILESFVLIAHDNPEIFNGNTGELIFMITKFVYDFDYQAFSFFGKLIKYVTNNDMNEIINTIAGIFIKKIDEINPIKIERVKKEFNQKMETPEPINEFKDKLFVPDFEMKYSPSIPQPLSYISLCGQQCNELVMIVSNTFKENQKMAQFFFNCICRILTKNTEKDVFYSEWFSAIEFIYRMKGCLSFNVSGILIHPNVFYEGDTIYSPSKDFKIINSLRSRAVDVLLESEYRVALETFLVETSKSPFLFAETCRRLISNNIKVSHEIGKGIVFASLLMDASILYQKLFFKYDYEGVVEARRASISLLAIFLQDNETVIDFFTEERTCTSFISLLYETNLKDFIMKYIHDFIVNTPNEHLTTLSNVLIKTLMDVSQQFPNVSAVEMFSTIIAAINDVFSYKCDLTDQFIDICPHIPKLFNTLEANESCRKFAKESVTFLAHLGEYYTINEKETASLENGITKIKTNDFLNSFRFNLHKLLAGEYISSRSSSFKIKSVYVPSIIIRIYYDTPYLSFVIDSLMELCEYSSHNIEVLGTYGFDLSLLDCLNNAKIENRLSKEIVQKMLDFFSLICLTKSTTQCVLKFIKLFSPTSDGIVSNYHYQFLNTFNKIIEVSNQQKISYFPLNGKSVAADTTFTHTADKGFSFTCWLYLENHKSDYRPLLFSVGVGNYRLGAYVSYNYVIAALMTNESLTSSKITDSIPPQQWVFVSLSFKPFPNRISIVLSINCQDCDPIVLPIIPMSQKITYEIGGGKDFSSVKTPYKMAAPILLEYTSPKDCSLIQSLGMNPNKSEIKNLLYAFDKIEGQVELMPQFLMKLVDRSVISALLPLMMNINLKKEDGTEVSQVEMFITILMNILNFSNSAQKNFLDSHGFEIISHIITTQWKSMFKFKTYSMLAQIMNIENKDLQKSLFCNILTNFDIITQMKPESHLRVLKSWSLTLFPSFQDISSEYLNHSRLLLVLSTFYWYTAKDGRKREIEFNVKACRVLLLRILYEYALQDFDESFFIDTIGSIVSSDDTQHCVELLQFLYSVIEEKIIKFSFDDPDIQQHLFSLFTIKNPTINSYGIRIITLLKSYGYEHEFFEKFIQLLINVYAADENAKEFFDACIEVLGDMPEVFPLCCYLANSIGGDAINTIESAFNPSFLEDIRTSLLVWPMKLCVSQPDDKQREMFEAMCKCKEEWLVLYDMLDIICQPYSEKSYKSKSIFINVLALLIIKREVSPSKQVIDNFFSLAKRFIFMHPKTEVNNCIAKLFQTFGEKVFSLKVQENTELKITLRFDEEGNWLDADIAQLCIEVYLEFNCNNYLNFVLILCSYLQRTKTKSIYPELSKMALTEKERTEYSSFIEFFNYHTEIAKLDQFFSGGKIPANSYFVNSFYETKLFNLFQMQNSEIRSLMRLESADIIKIMDRILIFSLKDLQTSVDDKISAKEKTRQEERNRNRTRWEKLWCSLSTQEGPWSSAVTHDKYQRRRSSVQSFGFVPVQLGNEIFKSSFSASKLDNEYIISYPCIYVKVDEKYAANFELTKEAVIIRIYNKPAVVFPVDELQAAFLLTNKRKSNGVQLINVNGESASLIFQGIDTGEITNTIYTLIPKRLKHIQLRGISEFVEMENLDDLWGSGEISNFEYISLLNRVDGRTFDDPNHYPVFPLLIPGKERDLGKLLKIPDKERVITSLSKIKPFRSMTEAVLKDYGEDYEATPEFYCFPDVFKGDFQLPSWAKDANDFVFQNRKLLESDEVSEKIHLWINAMWKFSKPHKQRNIREIKGKKAEIKIPVSGIFSAFFEDGKFSLLLNENTKINAEVDLENETVKVETIPTQKVSKEKLFVQLSLRSFAAVRTQPPFLQIVSDSNEKLNLVEDKYEAQCVSKDGPWISVGTTNSEILVFYNEKLKYLIPTFRDEIVEIAVKERFGMIAAVTKKGLLIVCSLINGAVSFCVPMGKVSPKKLLISNCSGFIICYSTSFVTETEKKFISVFSVNGELINKVELSNKVDSWTTFSSRKGIDFIAVSSGKKLLCSEVFLVDSMKTLKEENERSIFVDYYSDFSSILSLDNKGNLSSFPFEE